MFFWQLTSVYTAFLQGLYTDHWRDLPTLTCLQRWRDILLSFSSLCKTTAILRSLLRYVKRRFARLCRTLWCSRVSLTGEVFLLELRVSIGFKEFDCPWLCCMMSRCSSTSLVSYTRRSGAEVSLRSVYCFHNAMDQNPSWEANGFSADQETLLRPWKPNAQYNIRLILPLVPILSQIYLIHTFISDLLFWNFNITYPPIYDYVS
jgi:hypothetical protein